MPSFDYLCLGGVTISNAAQVYAYACEGIKPHTMTIRDCACPKLAQMLGDLTGYTRPELDNAVWYDPARPESGEFAGLLITDIKGLESAPVDRTVTNRAGDGAVIGRARLGPRVITVKGLLIGSSCCGIDYGMTWLSSALRGSFACGTGSCGGDDLSYLACCPACDCDEIEDADVAACAASSFRTLREVALTREPQITGRVGGYCSCCDTCPALEVEFQLTAGRPHALLPAVTVADETPWDVDSDTGECVTWVVGTGCADDAGCDTSDAATCMDTALAAIGCATTVPPDLPVPSNSCACEPMTRARTCIAIPSSVLTPIWSDVVLDLEIYAGANALRGVRVRFYPNPLGFASIDDLNTCDFCAEINITTVPASSTLRIDGSTRRVTVACPGGDEAGAGAAVSGTNGGPYLWPVLDCGVPYIACFEADAATIADDATITVRVISREQ